MRTQASGTQPGAAAEGRTPCLCGLHTTTVEAPRTARPLGYNVSVTRRAVVLVFALLLVAFAGAVFGGAAFGEVARGGRPAAPLPLPCGLPQAAPLWVDYADG